MGINENIQPVAWGVMMPFVVITSLTCILRVYSRVSISKSFGIDDWFMVAASVCAPYSAFLCSSNVAR